MTSSWRSQAGLFAGLLMGCGVLLFLAPAVGWAHQALRSSDPAANAELIEAPRELRLSFVEPVRLPLTSVSLRGPGGEAVGIASPRVPEDSDRELIVEVTAALSPGPYTVSWRTTGADGHPVQGEFMFVVLEGDSPSPPADTAPGAVAPDGAPESPPESSLDSLAGVSSPLYILTRWVTFTGLVGLLGSLFFKWAVLPRAGGASDVILARLGMLSSRAAGLGLVAALLLLAAAPARLVLQGASVTGGFSTVDADVLRLLATDGAWGVGWLVQVVGVLVVLAGLGAARWRQADAGWIVASIGAAGLAVFPALSGHAAGASSTPWLTVGADTLHVVGAGGWLGSLLAVLAVGIPVLRAVESPVRREAVRALVAAFSPVALACAGLVVLTGLLAASKHVGSLEALVGTEYGRTLLLKLGFVFVVFAAGAWNFLRVRPALGSGSKGANGERRLMKSGPFELAAGLLVLLVTAILVALPLPR
jgi:putative copper export protein/methionine-rich copper-binding protein CopC